MAKGRSSGLSIDSDLITTTTSTSTTSGFFLHKPTVLNSFPEDNQNLKTYTHSPNRKFSAITNIMDATAIRSPSATTIQFPVNLNCNNDHGDQHHHALDDDGDDKGRTIIDEMDFFSDKNAHDIKPTITNNTDHDQLKDSGSPTELELNVNVSNMGAS